MILPSIILAHFEKQANVCLTMGSPFTAGVCAALSDLVDETTHTGKRIANWEGDPAADALALRICGGFHAVALHNLDVEMAETYRGAAQNIGQAPPSHQLLRRILNEYDDFLFDWLALPPQTNETGRAGALLPGLLEIVRRSNLPIELCEIGSSAGLNLNLDRFRYQFNEKQWGDSNSPVQIKPELKNAVPELSGNLEIIERCGCDISPVDLTVLENQLRLRAYAWPDQEMRLARLSGAIDLALKFPPELIAQDAAKFVRDRLEKRKTGSAFVLMHSVVWQYLPEETQDEIIATLRKYGELADESNPIYWLRLEGFGGVEPHAGLLLDSWPTQSHDRLANSCFHGNWIEFLN